LELVSEELAHRPIGHPRKTGGHVGDARRFLAAPVASASLIGAGRHNRMLFKSPETVNE
jgi:hypothetical protein